MNKDDRRYRAAYHLLRDHIAEQVALDHLTEETELEAKALLDSLEVELSSTCADDTGDELARHKEALKVAIGALRELGLDYAHFTETVEKRVAAVLEPPEEFEEVGVGAYFVIPADGDTYTQVSEARALQMRDEGYQVAFLSATVKRPVKRAVVREVARENVSITDQGEIYGNATFWKHAECHGKTVTLIARWTE